MDGAGGDRCHRRVAVGGASPSTSLEVLVSQLHSYLYQSILFRHMLSQLLLRHPTHISWSPVEFSNFFWRVGSRSWVRGSGWDGRIKQTVIFKGQVFCTDNGCRLFIVHLVPHIRIQKIVIDWGQSMMISRLHIPLNWIVSCGDMLLMVYCPQHFLSIGGTFEVFHLDLSTEPAKWVKVEKLENWAIFISKDPANQALCCMDPERWGGRSNCIYCYVSEEWITCELGKPLHGSSCIPRFDRDRMMQPMWVVPSMFYPSP